MKRRVLLELENTEKREARLNQTTPVNKNKHASITN